MPSWISIKDCAPASRPLTSVQPPSYFTSSSSVPPRQNPACCSKEPVNTICCKVRRRVSRPGSLSRRPIWDITPPAHHSTSGGTSRTDPTASSTISIWPNLGYPHAGHRQQNPLFLTAYFGAAICFGNMYLVNPFLKTPSPLTGQ